MIPGIRSRGGGRGRVDFQDQAIIARIPGCRWGEVYGFAGEQRPARAVGTLVRGEPGRGASGGFRWNRSWLSLSCCSCLVAVEFGAASAATGENMIDFPNHSRSYDATRHAVRFWGYDSAIEASFYVSEAALARLQPGIPLDASGCLHAFDDNRDKICAAAARIYERGSRGSYDLGPANF